MSQATTETPARKTMRRFYEGKLAGRLAQVSHLSANRAMLRRGARKMQDGTLGQSTPEENDGEDPMNIRIGDEVHHHHPAADRPTLSAAIATVEAKSSGMGDLLKKAAIVAALLAGGAGGGAGLLSLLAPDPPTPAPATVDTDTQYQLQLGP